MEINEDDIEFDRSVAQKRHKELISSLNSVASKIEKNPDDSVLKDKFEKHLAAINKLAESFKAATKQEAPVVNITTDNKEIVESFRDIADQLITEISGLKECFVEKPKKWVFEFSRDRNGLMQSPIKIIAE